MASNQQESTTTLPNVSYQNSSNLINTVTQLINSNSTQSTMTTVINSSMNIDPTINSLTTTDIISTSTIFKSLTSSVQLNNNNLTSTPLTSAYTVSNITSYLGLNTSEVFNSMIPTNLTTKTMNTNSWTSLPVTLSTHLSSNDLTSTQFTSTITTSTITSTTATPTISSAITKSITEIFFPIDSNSSDGVSSSSVGILVTFCFVALFVFASFLFISWRRGKREIMRYNHLDEFTNSPSRYSDFVNRQTEPNINPTGFTNDAFDFQERGASRTKKTPNRDNRKKIDETIF